jgi:transcriptional regulator of acetoin/glycerol metabolism
VVRLKELKWSKSSGKVQLKLNQLPPEMQRIVVARGVSAEPPPVKLRIKRPTREEFVACLEEHQWNFQRVADFLGRDRRQIYRWIERYGLERP